MKKIFTLIMCAMIFCAGVLPASASAYTPANLEGQEQVQYMDDGSYFITIIETEENDGLSLMSTTTTKSKTATYYDSNGIAKWYVRVTGTFTYGNGTSKCTSSSVTAKSYDTSIWNISSKSASKSGNKAIATASARQYLSGRYVATLSKTVTLTCSPTGVFS